MIFMNQHRQFFFYNLIIFLFLTICLDIYQVLILLFYSSFQFNYHLNIEIIASNVKLGNNLIIALAKLFLLQIYLILSIFVSYIII